jgi:Dolichyl-phosphate-mannose-protein mannosyltransferase
MEFSRESTPLVSVSRCVAFWVLALLSAQFLAFGLVQAWRDSPTYDEMFHLAGGVTALTDHQLRLTPEHPPLPKLLAALPALAAHPIVPHGESWRRGDGFAYPAEFLQAQLDAGKLQRVTFASRLVPLAIAVGTGWALYALAARLFGRAAGLLAGGLWLTTPFVLGLGHIDGNDVGFTLTVVLAALALVRYLRAQTWLNAGIIGVAGGATLLVRVNGLAIVPVLAATVVLVAWPRLSVGLLRGGLVLLMAWATLWIGYRAVSPVPDFTRVDPMPGVDAPLTVKAVRLVPWPEEFDAGIYDVGRYNTVNQPAYLFGHAWSGANWWYWPGSLVVKLPFTVLAALVGGLVYWSRVDRARRRRAAMVLVAPAVVLTAIVLPFPQPKGARYLVPVIALGLVAASPLVTIAKRTWGKVLLSIIAAGQLAFLWQSQPHSLAWTAPPFRPGYQVATDSNLDWGQDFYRLQSWARAKKPVVLYFGPLDPVPNIPGSEPLFTSTDKPGVANIIDREALRDRWLAVSATALTSLTSRPALAWLRAYCPVGDLGATILLYRFHEPPQYKLRGSDRPAAPCDGDISHR